MDVSNLENKNMEDLLDIKKEHIGFVRCGKQEHTRFVKYRKDKNTVVLLYAK